MDMKVMLLLVSS